MSPPIELCFKLIKPVGQLFVPCAFAFSHRMLCRTWAIECCAEHCWTDSQPEIKQTRDKMFAGFVWSLMVHWWLQDVCVCKLIVTNSYTREVSGRAHGRMFQSMLNIHNIIIGKCFVWWTEVITCQLNGNGISWFGFVNRNVVLSAQILWFLSAIEPRDSRLSPWLPAVRTRWQRALEFGVILWKLVVLHHKRNSPNLPRPDNTFDSFSYSVPQ